VILSLADQSFILTTLNLASGVALIILAYYALRIFIHMRLGRLERGWRFITQGIAIVSLGFLFVGVDHALPRGTLIYFYIDSVGAVLSLVGIVFMLIGLHSHYVVWYKKSISSEKLETNEEKQEDLPSSS